MFDETITKLSDVGAAKARYLENNPAGFLVGSAMAGIYVGFGILLIFSLGSLLDPSVRPLVMGASFGLALILVVFAGAELYTGHTMNMTLAALEGKASLGQLGRVWLTSWVGNLLGAMLHQGAGPDPRQGRQAGRPGKMEAQREPARCL
jgi:nitrite transporter